MQLHCWSRGVHLLYALQLIARLFPSVSADSVTLPCREDQSASKSAEISCSGPLSGLSGPFSTLNHSLQGYQPPAEVRRVFRHLKVPSVAMPSIVT